MAEYIERDAARTLIKNFGKGAIDGGRMELDAVDDIILLASAVECLPAADVVPVVHGRWRWAGEDRWNDTYECLKCGKLNMDDSAFCPNCGAKMDGEEQND